MIPKRLELKNFLSYGDQVMPIDFTGMHLVSLSGDNGNGKSAILDAITWALWGEARGRADDLVRLGTDEMRVVFNFELNGHLYEVIRGRNKRNSTNVWELYVYDEAGNKKPLTGQGMRDTEAKIRRLLRMDYKTFINSAYIQQGRADEFTRQTVADRKKILADILDLSRYDELEQKAKERRNQCDQHIIQLEQQIKNYEAELEDEPALEQQLEDSQRRYEELSARLKESENELATLNASKRELDIKVREAEAARDKIKSLQSKIIAMERNREAQEQRINKAKALISRKPEILEGLGRLNAATEEIDTLDRKLQELRSLQNEMISIQMKIDESKRRLEMQLEKYEQQLNEIKKDIASLRELEERLNPLLEQVEQLDRLQQELLELQNRKTDLEGEYRALCIEYKQAEASKEDLMSKRQLLSKPDAKCPLCQSDLGEDKHRAILEDYDRQINAATRRMAELKDRASQINQEKNLIQNQINEINSLIKNGQAKSKELIATETKISEIRKRIAGKEQLEQSIKHIKDLLASEAYAEEYRDQLKAIQSQIGSLGYDEGAHKKLRDEIPKLRGYGSLAIELESAEKNLFDDEANLQSIIELIEAHNKSVQEYTRQMEELEYAVDELKRIEGQIDNRTFALEKLRSEEKQIVGNIATIRYSLERCRQIKDELESLRRDLEKAKHDRSIYSDLISVFGKKGVQALIIENAIPEIQDEANRLLARMTDNSMQISFDTQKDKKDGGISETLDIKISDDMGTRPYELYSGGEAFRVNFALRIALSRLLSRRAGAKLQTLIIDEGFGTQDGKGREKLIEAIDSIKDDFELILVISHIDELRDAFPTRIEVTKDEFGSQISVA